MVKTGIGDKHQIQTISETMRAANAEEWLQVDVDLQNE